MSNTGAAVTTSSGAAAETIVAKFDATRGVADAEAMRGLFDVEVYGIGEFALVPRNDLARALAATWLHGELKRSLYMAGVRKPTPGAANIWGTRDNVARLTFRMELPPIISDGGDPVASGREITSEERDIAIAAIEAHRESKRAKTVRAGKRRAR